MLLKTPTFAIRSDHDSFLPGIIFQEPIMTYIQPLVKTQFIERLRFTPAHPFPLVFPQRDTKYLTLPHFGEPLPHFAQIF